MSEKNDDNTQNAAPEPGGRPDNARALRRTVFPLVLLVGGMTGLSFAAVPLTTCSAA